MYFKIIILFNVICLSNFVNSQPTTFYGKQSNAIWRLVEKYHIQPKPLDDNLSAEIFDNFISFIDNSGYYFLESDFDELSKLKTLIDDDIKAKTSVFFSRAAQLFEIRLKAVDSLIMVIEAGKFDFEKDEVLSYADVDFPEHVSNYTELQERWRKWIKYATLDELFYGDYFEDPLKETVANLLTKIDLAKKDAIAYERFEIKSYLQHPAGYLNYLATYYLDAIATTFDPHTTYFSNIEKENFESELSKENLVFGISVEEDDKGVIRISSLMPGSPAWNSNELNKGDEILSLELNDGQKLEITTAGIDDITLMFNNSTGTKLTIKIRKLNGQESVVVIEKGEVYIEEDAIKNVILTGEKKIGYITLPDFYTEWDGDGGLGCANDVAKIIVKLQKENIDGLILDLRNNGGGSLKEAIDLAGIFIDWGPLTILQNKLGEANSIKDMNKGAIYLGPLVIMVNGLSASASELFAAAMQDYNRAIIVGSPTYGKASGQIILPVDPNYIIGYTNEKDLDESYGHLKLTVDKFYRITNSTHQKTGVIPDIYLNDFYDIYEYKESSYPNALEADSIVKKVYFTPFAKFPDVLAINSKKRIEANPNFKLLKTLIDSILLTYELDDIISLEIEKYQQTEKLFDEFLDQLFSLDKFATDNFKATNNLYDIEIMKMNAYRRELNEEYLKSIEEDVYIDESYQVLKDYLNLH